jgi:choline dehydrogenase
VAAKRAQSFDVIVVGSGSAGAVVTRRLVDAGARVLLLEAGRPDDNPAIHDPARIWELWESPDDWAYKTVPQTGCAGRILDVPRGKVLGGSTCLNGMIYIRGHRSDYDHWAYLGNHGWAYDDVLPLFKRSEDFDRGESAFHGVGGEVPVVADYEPHPFHAAVVEAAQEAGVPFNRDHNGAELDGVGFAQLMIRDGRRQSATTTFLRQVLDRPNLTVLTSARAHRLLFEGDRCAMVAYLRGGEIEHARADHEVVVSAGAIESPKLLLLSGIGNPTALRRLGIEVVAGLPGVGENLHDHALSPVILSSSRPMPPLVPGTQAIHSHLFARSRPGLIGPDLQPLFFQLPAYLPGMAGPEDGFTLMAGLIRPASRGTLRLTSTDPEDPPLLDPGYLTQETDVDALEASLRLCREIAQAGALAGWRGEELYPGREVTSRAELRDYIRRTTITYHHQVGTCKMGIDADAVVDPELRVYGVSSLRVADASIMPAVTSGNTHAPATMIGERAADLVRGALGVTSTAERILA